MSDVAVTNTTSGLSGKSLLAADVDATVTALHMFSRGSGSAPFGVGSGAAVVSNLDADKLDGVEGSSFATKTGSETLTNKTLTAPSISTITLTGGQIAFPAAQSASTNANTLDDYEEGTWTPTITGSGGASGQTYTTQVGKYVKVGKLVHVQGYILLSTLGTVTTLARIGGLPFTADTTANAFSSVVVSQWATLATSFVWLSGYVVPNTTEIELTGNTAATASSGNLSQANFNNTSAIRFSCTYVASA